MASSHHANDLGPEADDLGLASLDLNRSVEAVSGAPVTGGGPIHSDNLTINQQEKAEVSGDAALSKASDSATKPDGAAPVMRGGANTAFDEWGREGASTDEVHHRCLPANLDDGWVMREEEEGWDAEFMEETLLSAGSFSADRGMRRLETDVRSVRASRLDARSHKLPSFYTLSCFFDRAHRLEPLAAGGTELLVCNLRQFSLFVAVRAQQMGAPG